ncbi:MAG: DUF2786 domain-containing protein [Planctomycetota bacterium]
MNLDDRLTERIRKLLALAESQNPNEAAAAAARAAELMARYRIDRVLLEAHDPEVEDLFFEETREKHTWRGILADGVTRSFGCRIYWRHAPNGIRMHGVGTASDLAAARYLFELLAAEIESLAERCADSLTRTASESGWRRDFLLSAASTLRVRLREHSRETRDRLGRSDENEARAPALLDRRDRRAADYLERLHCARSGPVRYRDPSGRAAGRRAADSIDLDPQRPRLPDRPEGR